MNNKIKVNIFTPVHLTEIFVGHDTREALVRMVNYNIQAACRAQASMLWTEVIADHSDVQLPTKTEILENETIKGDYDTANKIPI